MDQLIQVAGALLILAAYAGGASSTISTSTRARYLWLNLVGAAILAVLAFAEEQWGFLLLESVWTLVSAWGLFQVMRGRQPGSAH